MTDNETIVRLASGHTLRSGSSTDTFTSGEYVRLCAPDGTEVLYWDNAEWAEDPILVMGAIMNAAAAAPPTEVTAIEAELAALEAEFEAAGGRGVELAEEIDALRNRLFGPHLGTVDPRTVKPALTIEVIDQTDAMTDPIHPDEPRAHLIDCVDRLRAVLSDLNRYGDTIDRKIATQGDETTVYGPVSAGLSRLVEILYPDSGVEGRSIQIIDVMYDSNLAIVEAAQVVADRNAPSVKLYDADTAEPIGPATPEQIEASNQAAERDGGSGIIRISADGEPVADGTWGADQPGVRRVYTR